MQQQQPRMPMAQQNMSAFNPAANQTAFLNQPRPGFVPQQQPRFGMDMMNPVNNSTGLLNPGMPGGMNPMGANMPPSNYALLPGPPGVGPAQVAPGLGAPGHMGTSLIGPPPGSQGAPGIFNPPNMMNPMMSGGGASAGGPGAGPVGAVPNIPGGPVSALLPGPPGMNMPSLPPRPFKPGMPTRNLMTEAEFYQYQAMLRKE